ncbi:MAG: helix-turn-helix domain-containing protein [Xanthomonadales bacterium]|nr:helix-turn-helix domain-containing protein [Xanthomonadales bacterium]
MNLVGERIKHARTSCGLSQAQLAEAISAATGGKVTKSLISQWESGRVASPNTANLLAMQSVTGFRAEWLLQGISPQKIEESPAKRGSKPAELDVVLLERILREVFKTTTDPKRAAKSAVRMYQSLAGSDGNINPLTLLARFAATEQD